jgi:hypothetical protein
VDALVKVAPDNDQVAIALIRANTVARGSATPTEKAKSQQVLLSLARSMGFGQSDVLLCACVTTEGIVVYAFYATKATCHGNC